jgi:hypothetical protein
VIVVDTSFVVALLDRRDTNHVTAAGWYDRTNEELATTPLVLAEIDYLAAAHAGAPARDAFRADVAAGAYTADWWPTAAREAVDIARRHRELGLSLTDASLVALAGRLGTTRVATFDERHFRAVTPLRGGAAFVLLPADG